MATMFEGDAWPLSEYSISLLKLKYLLKLLQYVYAYTAHTRTLVLRAYLFTYLLTYEILTCISRVLSDRCKSVLC